MERLKDSEIEFQSKGEHVSGDFWKTEPGKKQYIEVRSGLDSVRKKAHTHRLHVFQLEQKGK